MEKVEKDVGRCLEIGSNLSILNYGLMLDDCHGQRDVSNI